MDKLSLKLKTWNHFCQTVYADGSTVSGAVISDHALNTPLRTHKHAFITIIEEESTWKSYQLFFSYLLTVR